MVTVAGEAIRLRPTLRAATTLVHAHGGFDSLFRAVMDGSITDIASIIVAATTRWPSPQAFLSDINEKPLGALFDHLSVAALNCLLSMADTGDSEQTPSVESSNTITIADYYDRLFGIATGWLGWPPESAWNATPAEIRKAYNGRVELLRAIFGGKDDNDDNASQNHTPEQIAAGFASLRSLVASGGNMGI